MSRAPAALEWSCHAEADGCSDRARSFCLLRTGAAAVVQRSTKLRANGKREGKAGKTGKERQEEQRQEGQEGQRRQEQWPAGRGEHGSVLAGGGQRCLGTG